MKYTHDAPAEPWAVEVVEGGALLVVVAGPIEKEPVVAKTSLIFLFRSHLLSAEAMHDVIRCFCSPNVNSLQSVTVT
jgi:hypothetical protein